MRFTKSLLVFLLAITAFACDDENKSGPVNVGSGFLVLNEGNFGSQNASLDFVDLDEDTVFSSVFSGANGLPLGDVANDIAVTDTFAVIAVNNSNKVEVISTRSFVSLASLPILQPREIAVVGQSAYITSYNDFTDGRVFKINIADGVQEPAVIGVGSNPEGIAYLEGKLYVANGGFGFGSSVTVIDALTDFVIGEVPVRANPVSIAVDESDGQVYVACQGRSWDSPPAEGGIMVIHFSNVVVDSITGSGFYPGDVSIADGRGVYVTGFAGDVKVFDATDHSEIGTIAGPYYSAFVFPGDSRIFVTDASDFVADGRVLIYDENLQQTATYPAGVIPGTVVKPTE